MSLSMEKNSFGEKNNSGKNNESGFQQCEFKNHLAILRQLPVFSRLPLDSLKVFAYLCDKEIFRTDDYLFRQGEDDGQAFYIKSGSVRLIRENGADELEIRTYGAESFISLTALMGRVHRLYSMKAAGETVCLVMRREKMRKALAQFPELMPKVVESIVEQVYEWEKRFLNHHADKHEVCLQSAGISMI